MKYLKILILVMMVAFSGCGPKTPEYKKKLIEANGTAPELVFHRYEDVLFNLDTSRFQEALMEVQEQYLPFLGGDLTDTLAVKYLRDFAVDTLSISLYHKVKTAFERSGGDGQKRVSAFQLLLSRRQPAHSGLHLRLGYQPRSAVSDPSR